jgi:hypothetical protein
MKTTRVMLLGLIAINVLALWPAKSAAIPVFARKYGFNCTMCHSAFPRLNDFGTRYRQNGYQLPNREHDEKTVLESPTPFAMRLSAGYTSERYTHVSDAEDTRGFMMNGLDLLSAGLLGRNIGYFLVYTPEIAESRGVEGQTGSLEMASVVFSNIGSPWLNVRVGRFEPAYAAFSVKRHLTFSPYDIYEYGAPSGLAFSETQEGIELTGNNRSGGMSFGYAAGYVNGSATNRRDDDPVDFYVRATAVYGPGEGQTAGQKIGVTGYFGKARPDTGLSDCQSEFMRIAADASLNFRQVNLALQYLYGKDDRELWHMADDVAFSGGFAELSVMPMTSLVAFGRFDLIRNPDVDDQDITRWTGGMRYYFVNNCALHLEYSRLTQDVAMGDDPIVDGIMARVDFAF